MEKLDEGIYKQDNWFVIDLDRLLESQGFIITQGTREVVKDGVKKIVRSIWPEAAIEFY